MGVSMTALRRMALAAHFRVQRIVPYPVELFTAHLTILVDLFDQTADPTCNAHPGAAGNAGPVPNLFSSPLERHYCPTATLRGWNGGGDSGADAIDRGESNLSVEGLVHFVHSN